MDDKHNPYAPSRASLAGAAVTPSVSGGAWRDGTVLILTREASLPSRCVRCNEPSAEPTKTRRIYWHSPWLYLLILANFLIYALVALIVRKKAVVAPGLCSAHKKRRLTGIVTAWALLIAGFALMFMGITGGKPGVAVVGLLLILVALLVSASVTRIVRAKRIDAQYIQLKGCGAAFLDSMPPFAG
ncbi:MAG TPA: hypothetical protein VFX20_19595 [Steroidobacteraceae bacterium]|nr:hypothetical protein [Steroidobacteraceae bacterium]